MAPEEALPPECLTCGLDAPMAGRVNCPACEVARLEDEVATLRAQLAALSAVTLPPGVARPAAGELPYWLAPCSLCGRGLWFTFRPDRPKVCGACEEARDGRGSRAAYRRPGVPGSEPGNAGFDGAVRAGEDAS